MESSAKKMRMDNGDTDLEQSTEPKIKEEINVDEVNQNCDYENRQPETFQIFKLESSQNDEEANPEENALPSENHMAGDVRSFTNIPNFNFMISEVTSSSSLPTATSSSVPTTFQLPEVCRTSSNINEVICTAFEHTVNYLSNKIDTVDRKVDVVEAKMKKRQKKFEQFVISHFFEQKQQEQEKLERYIPFETIESFQNFDRRLQEDQFFHAEFERVLNKHKHKINFEAAVDTTIDSFLSKNIICLISFAGQRGFYNLSASNFYRKFSENLIERFGGLVEQAQLNSVVKRLLHNKKESVRRNSIKKNTVAATIAQPLTSIGESMPVFVSSDDEDLS